MTIVYRNRSGIDNDVLSLMGARVTQKLRKRHVLFLSILFLSILFLYTFPVNAVHFTHSSWQRLS